MKVFSVFGVLLSLSVLTACATPSSGGPPSETDQSTPTGAPTGSESAPSAAPTPTAPTENYRLGPNGECDARQLDITIEAQPTASGMGQFYSEIMFTNSSTVACILDGPPAMFTLIDSATGTPIGIRGENEGSPERVDLQPGDTAYSTIHFTTTGVYDCETAIADAVQLSPPDWDASTTYSLERPVESCLDLSNYSVSYVSSESLFTA